MTSSDYSVVAGHQITSADGDGYAGVGGGGARTVYTVAFTTSATGGLSAAAHSQITIAFPAGTDLSTVAGSQVTE